MNRAAIDPHSKRVAEKIGERGIVLAIVLVLIFVLVIAVTAFQRRAIIDTSIATNRLRANEADSLARGGLRIGAATAFVIQLKQKAGEFGPSANASRTQPIDLAAGPGALDKVWSEMGDYELAVGEGRTLRVSIEDEGARLNLNSLVDQSANFGGKDDDAPASSISASNAANDAEDYLIRVLEYIIDGIEPSKGATDYDIRAIARNLIDYMDADDEAIDGRDEDRYYREQDPPYSARNGPFLSFDEIGLVEGVDARLLDAMRNYLTVYPIGGTRGINLNRAEPWVLAIVYSGTSGNRELIREQTVRDIWALRQDSKILCDNRSYDRVRCVSPNDVGNGELANGSIFPGSPLPATASVFRVVSEARVGNLVRKFEAIYDSRSPDGPRVLSWRRLRGGNH